MKYGLILPEVRKEDYVFGSSLRLQGDVLQPDGQWDAYLPPDEKQNTEVETMACTTFGTLNAVEILEKREFEDITNWSDRFLAKISGTSIHFGGNNPQIVAEILRKKGCVKESEWATTPDIDTAEQYYANIPANILTLAQEFTAKYEFGHEYVGTSQQSMMDALKCSPLCADVYAWGTPDSNSIYHRNGEQSNHWICIYGYEPNHYWKVFDSYDNTKKKLAWDFGFTVVKRYTLHKKVIYDSWFDIFIHWFRIALGLDTEFGAQRSPDWRNVRNDFLMMNSKCAVCETTKKLEVHHLTPFHTDETKELDMNNLITLCRDHHYLFGHLLDWKSYNSEASTDARIMRDKIKTRP